MIYNMIEKDTKINQLNTDLTPQNVPTTVRASRITINDSACYFNTTEGTAHVAVVFTSNMTGTLPLFDIANCVRRTQALTCVDFTNGSSPTLTPCYASANSNGTTSFIATVTDGHLYSINGVIQVYASAD